MSPATDPQETLALVTAALSPEYEVSRELGRGGMAVVYLAESQNPRRQVAIKVMNPDLSTRVMRERFLREISLASNLTHPHIVPVFAAGEADGMLYYVMPFIQGESLRACLERDGPMLVGNAMRLAGEVASALSYAHDQGVIHRDIKPENILLADGHAMVVDFGVARAFVEDAGLTGTGAPIGTPAYMSPEQWTGKDVDGRTDVYALGSVLFEMVYGRAPEGPPSERAAEALNMLRTSGLGRASLSVAPVVAKALAADPRERYASAREFAAAISPQNVATAASPIERMVGFVIGTAVVVLAVAGGVRLWSYVSAREAAMPSRVAVAVLDNQTGDDRLAPLGVMAADWITQGLTRTGLVEVVGTRSSLAFSGELSPDAAIARLAEETGARIVISGSYYTEGSNVQFSVRFTDVAGDRVLISLPPVSSHVDSPLVAVEILRQRVMGALATLFDARFESWATAGSQPPLYNAYEEFIEGHRSLAAFDYEATVAHYVAASELDPSFTAPLLMAAFAAAVMDRWETADSIARRTEMRRGSLNPVDRSILDWILGLTTGNSRRARTAIADAFELSPNRETRMFAGITLMWLNRPGEALLHFDSIVNDTDDQHEAFLGYWQVYTAAYHLLERHEEELALARRARALHPRDKLIAGLEMRALAAMGLIAAMDSVVALAERMPPGVLWDTGDLLRITGLELKTHRFDEDATRYAERAVEWYLTEAPEDRYGLARSLYQAGRYEEARPLFDQLAAASPDSIGYLGYAATAAAYTGDIAAARQFSDSLVTLQRGFLFGHVPYWRARIAAVMGEPDVAMRFLRESADAGRRMTWSTHMDIDLQQLRDHEPYRGFIREPL